MSEFSDMCKAYVEKSNTNIYQIAKKSGLDRTMLQKMVKGTKVPSEPFFEKFCEFLVMNKAERNELEQLFKIERIGRDVYASRCEIEKLISEFSKLSDSKLIERKLPIEAELGGMRMNDESLQLDSAFDLVDAIQYIVKEECELQEHPHIYLDVFDLAPFALNQILKYEQHIDKPMDCFQFVKFSRSNPTYNATVENIQVLRMVFPFAFKHCNSYKAYYSYINGNRSDGIYNIWDHYIVTQSKVLLIADDCPKGLLINSPSVSASYIERMEHMKEECESLFDHFEQEKNTSVEQRIDWVKQYYADMDTNTTYPLNEYKERKITANGLNVELFEPNHVVFSSVRKDFPFGIVCIKETELYEAFLDYFHSLEGEEEYLELQFG